MMKRRAFFSACIGLPVAGTLRPTETVTPSDPRPDTTLRCVQTFNEPVSALVTFQDRVFVATGSSVYELWKS